MTLLIGGREVQYLCRSGKAVEHLYIGGKAAYRRNWFPDFDYDDDTLQCSNHNGHVVFKGTTNGQTVLMAQQLFQPGTYRIEGDYKGDAPAWRIGNINVQPTCRWPERWVGEKEMTVDKAIMLDIFVYGISLSLSLSRTVTIYRIA